MDLESLGWTCGALGGVGGEWDCVALCDGSLGNLFGCLGTVGRIRGGGGSVGRTWGDTWGDLLGTNGIWKMSEGDLGGHLGRLEGGT